MSFKQRTNDYIKDGRGFTCFTEDSLLELLKNKINVYVAEVIQTSDVSEGRSNES